MTYSPPSANAPSLRDAVADDSPAIVALVRALAAHIGDVSLAKVTPEGLAAALAAPDPLCRAVVAESAKGDIVGVWPVLGYLLNLGRCSGTVCD